ncbi:hypothetical protein [Pyxidicoccus trucidator]|uniref:hypothetical protein n=1 Tax=Pyxidicoccus trucidator TaxID=2709662 RepID=UPI0013DC91BD|nr:hypothetical protein [Pyxidicoccus trucidator]
MDATSTLPDFALMQGGPFFRLECRVHLFTPQRDKVLARTLVIVALAWLPLLFLSMFERGTALGPLFGDLQIHAQLLVSMPALILSEPYVNGRIRLAVQQFLSSHLVGVGSRRSFERAVCVAIRWRDSAWVEAGLVAVCLGLSLLERIEPNRGWAFALSGGELSPAGWWYLAVSRPLFIFLLLRWVWRGVVWAGFLFRVSRLPLALMPTHPDTMGGLGFLPVYQACFAPLVFALQMVMAAATWRTQAAGLAADPIPHIIPLAVIGVMATVVVFAPLVFFMPQLVKAKRRGDPAFSALAAWHSRRFERKWFHERSSEDVLGAPEFSSLADLGSTFILARKMRVFPWDPRPLMSVAAAAVLPIAILLVMDRHFLEVLKLLRQGLG